MATQVISISVTSTGARQVSVGLRDIGTSARQSQSAVEMLNSALALVGSFLAVDKIRDWSDAWASATGQIRVVTTTQQQATAVTNQLYQAANNSRQSFTQLVNLYQRLAIGGRDLGASQNDMLKVTNTVANVLASSHVTVNQASGALLQLSQSFASSRVRAQEFNSVTQGLPALMQIAADHIDGAGGSIGKLRQMMLAGKLSSKEFFDAILAGAGEAQEGLNKSSAMIGQAISIFTNGMTRVVGQLTETLGVGDGLVNLAKLIANNTDQATAALLAFGAAAAVAFAPTVLTTFASGLRVVTTLLLANPFTAILAGLAAMGTYLYSARNSLKGFGDDITTLGDVGAQVWPGLRDGVTSFASSLTNDAMGAIDSFLANTTGITAVTENVLATIGAAWTDYFQGVDGGFSGFLEGVARVYDSVKSIVVGTYNAMSTVVTGFPALLQAELVEPFGAFGTFAEKVVQGVIYTFEALMRTISRIGDGINSIVSSVPGVSSLLGTSLRNIPGPANGSLIGDAINAYRNTANDHSAENGIRGAISRAQQAALARSQLPTPDAGLDVRGTPVQLPQRQRRGRQDPLPNQLRTLENRIDPSSGAILDQAKDIGTLDSALKAHLITQTQHDKLVQQTMQHYKDIIDPLGKINTTIDQQTRLLGLNNDDKRIEQQLEQYRQQLLQAGKPLDASQTASLRAKLVAQQQLNETMEAYNTIYSNTIGMSRTGEAAIRGADRAQRDGLISSDTADVMRQQGYATQSNARLNAGRGSDQDILVGALGKAQQGYTNVSTSLKDTFGDTLRSFEDDYASSIAKAISGNESLSQSFKRLAQDGIQTLIGGLIKLGEQYLVTQALGAILPKSLGLGLLGGAATDAGGSDAGASLAGGLYATGGYTGDGDKYAPAGTVHKGEYVLTQEETKALGLDTGRKLGKGSTQESNVVNSATSNSFSFGDIHVQGSTNSQGQMDDKAAASLQRQVADMVSREINRTLANQQRVGGKLYGTGRG